MKELLPLVNVGIRQNPGSRFGFVRISCPVLEDDTFSLIRPNGGRCYGPISRLFCESQLPIRRGHNRACAAIMAEQTLKAGSGRHGR